MNRSDLEHAQQVGYSVAKESGATEPDPGARRAELLADARELRLRELLNSAVFWGTLKAHLTLAVLGGIAWAVLVYGTGQR